jgi:hypothetical protein
MNIKQYLSKNDVLPVTDIKNIETYCNPKDKRRKLAIDKRSYQRDGMWYVHPICVVREELPLILYALIVERFIGTATQTVTG